MPPSPILRIALSGPLRCLFDYLPPEDCALEPLPGMRLRVPFGRGNRCGMLVKTARDSEIPAQRLKPATALIDSEPLLSPDELKLLHWAADYYQHPLGDVIFHALPGRLRKGLAPVTERISGWRLTPQGRLVDPKQLKRAPRQASLLAALANRPEGLSRTALTKECGECSAILRTLKQKLWIEPWESTAGNPQVPKTAPSPAPVLTDAQQSAVKEVSARFGQFEAFLLDGVTGSGKTEVYLHLIQQLASQQRQTLVLVPEIGLTPQLVRRFEQRLQQPVALLHSGLSDSERETAWFAARRGESRVVVGTRSAVFTPMPNLGLILVDEEHDLSLKQQEGFRYSARDLALVRARQAGCPVLLGSATPSLESLRNVQLKRYQRLNLPTRAGNAELPGLALLDIRSVHLDGGLSPGLIKQIGTTLQAGQQAMLFLNRRGFAPVLTCHACGWLSECPRCDARMTLHLASHLLWCHHCGHQQTRPDCCPSCGSPDLRPLGQGTERLEMALRQQFPDTSIARIDRDSTQRKGSLQRLLGEIRAGHYPLLIGTQMLAKGHHFPEVTLVGIIDVDQGLFGADFRAAERMAQLIMQVAGRAGRAEKPGQVLIQTRHPDHPLLQTLIHQGYEAFAREALSERRLANLPPFSYQVLLRAESTRREDPALFLQAAADCGKALPNAGKFELWGPVPAPMERRAGRVRAHLLIQAANRQTLQQWLAGWVQQLTALPSARKVRWSVDVDPQDML